MPPAITTMAAKAAAISALKTVHAQHEQDADDETEDHLIAEDPCRILQAR
jgi:hypothetical protein